jgi:sugar-phosphatase
VGACRRRADARRCLVVEDAEAGVRGGRAAGATVAALKGVPADIAIAGLSELTSLLRAARVRSRT